MSRVRWGRGRTPDPDRTGTVYRAGPGLQLRRPKDAAGLDDPAAARVPVGMAAIRARCDQASEPSSRG